MNIALTVILAIWLLGWLVELLPVILNVRNFFSKFLAEGETNYSWVYEIVLGSLLETILRFIVLIAIRALWPFRVWGYLVNAFG